MRELELREKKVNDIQAMGDKLVREGHPGKKTVEVITQLNSATVWKLLSEFSTNPVPSCLLSLAGLHSCPADSVELAPPIVLLH